MLYLIKDGLIRARVACREVDYRAEVGRTAPLSWCRRVRFLNSALMRVVLVGAFRDVTSEL